MAASEPVPVFVQEVAASADSTAQISECLHVSAPGLSAKLARRYGKSSEEVPIIVRREGSTPVVRTGFFVYGMDSIDSMQQTFEGRFQVNLEWRPVLREAEAWADNPVQFKPEWEPLLYWKNARTTARENVQTYGDGMTIAMYQDEDGSLLFQKCLEYTIVFTEMFELKNFPFDVQPLRMFFAAQWEFYPAVQPYPALVPRCDDGPFMVFEFANVNLQRSLNSGGAIFLPDAKDAYGLSVCFVNVVRDWKFYLWRVVGVNFIIGLFSFAAFAFHPIDDLTDRISLLSTTLLTAVAFIFILCQYLPPLPHMTLLDKYMACLLGFIAWMALHCVLLKSMITDESPETVDDADKALLGIDGSMFILGHILFAGRCRLAYKEERGKLSQTKVHLNGTGIDDRVSRRLTRDSCQRGMLKTRPRSE